jgi:hypothetical protein
MELHKPDHLISLASSAVLVSVDVNVWSATKQDRIISNEVTASKNADKSAGRYVKNLLADDQFHKRVANYRQTIYNWLKRSTFRWNNAQDILPVINLEKFKKEFNDQINLNGTPSTSYEMDDHNKKNLHKKNCEHAISKKHFKICLNQIQKKKTKRDKPKKRLN